ncbi:MAG: AAA family ATPase [Azonexus sp.]|jgi:DNA transposition AAA+ family ATPase|nr:AAA family ATPase [Azonexus sp.]
MNAVSEKTAPQDIEARQRRDAKADADDRQLRAYIDDLLAAAMPPSRIAIEAGVSLQGFKAWLNEAGGGDVAPALLAWKAAIERAAEHAGGFVKTPTAQKIIRAFDRARQAQGGTAQRGIALIYGASGVGKSETAAWYQGQHQETRAFGQWPVALVRCTGLERDAAAIHTAILNSMAGEFFHYRQTHEKKIDAIVARLSHGGIIIFDEAQLLSHRRLDELRLFPDQHGVAIALMGNLSGYKELVDAKIAQIMSRVVGARVVVDAPSEGDVDALLDAWEIRGRKERALAVLIGTQDGGLRLLSSAVSAARLLAQAKGAAIDADLLQAAAASVGAWGDGR